MFGALAEYGQEVKRRCNGVTSAIAQCKKYLPMVILVGMGIAMLALWCRKRKPISAKRRKNTETEIGNVSMRGGDLTVIVDVSDPTAFSDVLRLCVRLWTKAKRPRDLYVVVRFLFDDGANDDDDSVMFWDPMEKRIGNSATFDWRRRTRVVHHHRSQVKVEHRHHRVVLWLGTPLWRPVRDWDVRLLAVDCRSTVLTQHHSGEASERDDRYAVIRRFVDWSERGPFPLTRTNTSAFPSDRLRHPSLRAWIATSEWCLMSAEIWSILERTLKKNTISKSPIVRQELDWILTLIVRLRTDRLFCTSPHASGFVPIASCSDEEDQESVPTTGTLSTTKFDWFGFLESLRQPERKTTVSTSSSARLIHTLATDPKTRARLETVLASLGVRWWPDYARAPFARDGLVWPLDPEEMRIVLGRTVTLSGGGDDEDE